jgi:hypothetical protein
MKILPYAKPEKPPGPTVRALAVLASSKCANHESGEHYLARIITRNTADLCNFGNDLQNFTNAIAVDPARCVPALLLVHDRKIGSNHGTYHRGQITTMLRQLDAVPSKSMDLIAFHRERNRKARPGMHEKPQNVRQVRPRPSLRELLRIAMQSTRNVCWTNSFGAAGVHHDWIAGRIVSRNAAK